MIKAAFHTSEEKNGIFSKSCLGKLCVNLENKIKLDPFIICSTKVNSRWLENMKVK